jgi:NAD(P)-dependent dehydrogenase (short-subunit alcohol dehydrogenase family)
MRAQRSGRIINISSVLGFLPGPYTGVYAASKHAVEGFSESLDHEVRQFGIRVSVVEPGFTRTRLAANGELTGQRLPAYRAEGTLAQEAVRGAIAAGDDPRTRSLCGSASSHQPPSPAALRGRAHGGRPQSPQTICARAVPRSRASQAARPSPDRGKPLSPFPPETDR